MEKSILLEPRDQTMRLVMVVIFFGNGTLLFIGNDHEDIRIVVGITVTTICLAYIVYSLLAFSAWSKYAAKIRVTDESIELKTSFWKPLIEISWEEVQTIELGNFQVDFELRNGTKSVIYNTSPERSIQFKQLLREAAEQRNIEISRG